MSRTFAATARAAHRAEERSHAMGTEEAQSSFEERLERAEGAARRFHETVAASAESSGKQASGLGIGRALFRLAVTLVLTIAIVVTSWEMATTNPPVTQPEQAFIDVPISDPLADVIARDTSVEESATRAAGHQYIARVGLQYARTVEALRAAYRLDSLSIWGMSGPEPSLPSCDPEETPRGPITVNAQRLWTTLRGVRGDSVIVPMTFEGNEIVLGTTIEWNRFFEFMMVDTESNGVRRALLRDRSSNLSLRFTTVQRSDTVFVVPSGARIGALRLPLGLLGSWVHSRRPTVFTFARLCGYGARLESGAFQFEPR